MVVSLKKRSKQSAFTLVELIIVIAIIGILATLTFFSIGAWRESLAKKEVQSDLSNVATAMDNAKNWSSGSTSGYPTFSPGTKFDGNATTKNIFTESKHVDLTYVSGDAKSFCIDAVSSARSNIKYFIDTANGKTPKTGSCTAGGGADADDSEPEVATQASCFETEDVTGGVRIKAYDGAEGSYLSTTSRPECPLDVVIPNQINGRAVVAIGWFAFGNAHLTSVVIPNSVISIGADAFDTNNLTSVNIPNSVTSFGSEVFNENQISSLPTYFSQPSVTTIPPWIFQNNNFSSLIIPDNITSIGDVAFRYNHLTSITIPDSVTSIGLQSFAGNQLTSVSLPTGTTLGSQSFDNSVTITRR